jgi:hypothetical protein
MVNPWLEKLKMFNAGGDVYAIPKRDTTERAILNSGIPFTDAYKIKDQYTTSRFLKENADPPKPEKVKKERKPRAKKVKPAPSEAEVAVKEAKKEEPVMMEKTSPDTLKEKRMKALEKARAVRKANLEAKKKPEEKKPEEKKEELKGMRVMFSPTESKEKMKVPKVVKSKVKKEEKVEAPEEPPTEVEMPKLPKNKSVDRLKMSEEERVKADEIFDKRQMEVLKENFDWTDQALEFLSQKDNDPIPEQETLEGLEQILEMFKKHIDVEKNLMKDPKSIRVPMTNKKVEEYISKIESFLKRKKGKSKSK